MVFRHGGFAGDIHTTSFAGNFERLVDPPKYLEIKPPVPPEDLVEKYFHEVGAAGKLAERSKALLQKAIEQEQAIAPQIVEQGAQVKSLWGEFESFLYGAQPELAPTPKVPAPAKPRAREEIFELRLHKCDPAEADRVAVEEAEAKAAGKKKKKGLLARLLGKKTKDEQKAAVEEETKKELEESQGKWTIQGLWPLWASDCPGKKFDVKKMSKIKSDLDAKWPSCAESPDEPVEERKVENVEFWKNEYEKHGTCSEFGQNKFFKKGLELFEKYAEDCPKEPDQDECRICLDKKMKNKVDCPKDDAEPSFPKPEEEEEEKKNVMTNIWDMVTGKKKDSEKESAIAAADEPPTPPWAHDPMASAWVRSKGSMAERAEVAAQRAEGAATLAAGSAEESIVTVAKAEEQMKSKHGGLRQAWRTGIATVTPQVIGSLEDAKPPELLSTHAGFANEESTGLHCREVCHETNEGKETEEAVKKSFKACAIQ